MLSTNVQNFDSPHEAKQFILKFRDITANL